MLIAGFYSPYPTVFSDTDYGNGRDDLFGKRNINDERGIYYQNAGLLKALESGDVEFPDHWWAVRAREIREGKIARVEAGIGYEAYESFLVALVERNGLTAVTTWQNVGFSGFYAGPKVHILGWGDPLLARLPAILNPRRGGPGHVSRITPEGYVATHLVGENMIADSSLAVYYDRLCLITKGNLLDPERLAVIWKMNKGGYDHLIDYDAYQFPSKLEKLASVASIRPFDPARHIDLAQEYFELGESEEAEASLSRALQLNPYSFNNHYLAGTLFERIDRSTLAAAAYRRAVSLGPETIRLHTERDNRNELFKTHVRLFRAGEAVGDFQSASEALKKAIKSGPDDGELVLKFYRWILNADFVTVTSSMYTKIGIELSALGMVDDSIVAHERALSKNREETAARKRR